MSTYNTCYVCDLRDKSDCCGVCYTNCCDICITSHKQNDVCNLLKEHHVLSRFCRCHIQCVTKFCPSCNELVCTDCDVKNHGNHNTVKLDDAFDSVQSTITDYLYRLGENESETKLLMTNYADNKSLCVEIRNEINKRGTYFRQLCANTKDRLQKEINQNEIQSTSAYLTKKGYFDKISKTAKILNLLKHVKSPVTFLKIWTQINIQLKQLDVRQAIIVPPKKIAFHAVPLTSSGFGEIFGSIVCIDDKCDDSSVHDDNRIDRLLSSVHIQDENNEMRQSPTDVQRYENTEKDISDQKASLEQSSVISNQTLAKDNEVLRKEISDLKTALKDTLLKSEHEKLVNENEGLKKEISRMEQTIESTSLELRQTEKLVNENEGLKKEISLLEQKIESTSFEFRESEKERREMLIIAEKLHMSLSSVDCHKEAELKHTGMSFTEIMQNATHNVQTNGKKFQTLVQENEMLKKTISYQQTTLDNDALKSEQIEKLFKENEGLKEEIARLEQKIESTSFELSQKLAQENEMLKNEISDQQTAFDNAVLKSDQIKKLFKENEGLKEDISRLEQQNESTLFELRESEKERREMLIMAEELHISLSAVDRDKEAELKHTGMSFTEIMQNATDNVQTIGTKFQTLALEKEMLKKQISDQQTTLDNNVLKSEQTEKLVNESEGLKEKISRLEHTIESTSFELSHTLAQENEMLKKKISDQQATLENNTLKSEQTENLVKENEELKEEISRLEHKIESTSFELSFKAKNETIQHLQEEKKKLKEFATKLQQELLLKDQEIKEQNERAQKLDRQRQNALEGFTQQRSLITKLSNEKEYLQGIVNEYYDIKALTESRDELQARVDMQLSSIESKEDKIQELRNLLRQKDTTIIEMQKEKNDFETREKMVVSSAESEKLQIDRLKRLLREQDDTIRKLQKEKDDFQTRLSSVAGDKLIKGNTAITDLGDPNRPMKISEKYGELYDNEWTDAMERITDVKRFYPDKKKSELEEIVTRHLYTILFCCYTECQKLAKEQLQTIEDAVLKSILLPVEQAETDPSQIPGYKEIINIRRQVADKYAKVLLQKGILKSRILKNDKQGIEKNEEVMELLIHTPFFEKCVYLCWYMAVQDPVMHLDDGPKPGTIFDKNIYREFVKSGDKVKFTVWPALFLHKRGPVLYKGVVQPY